MEIAVDHLRRGNGSPVRDGSIPVAEALVGCEEKRPIAPIVDFRNPDGAADGGAEIVLLIHLPGRLEEPARVECIVARIFVRDAMKVVGPRRNKGVGPGIKKKGGSRPRPPRRTRL